MMKKKKSTHFSDSTHQECMVFARIGYGSCYYHWNEIFAGVCPNVYTVGFLPPSSCHTHLAVHA